MLLPCLASGRAGYWQTRRASESTPRKQRTRRRVSDCPWPGRNGGDRRQHRERDYRRSFDRFVRGVPQEAGPSSRDVPLWGWDFKGRDCPVGPVAPARVRCRNKRIGAGQFASSANEYSSAAAQRGDLCARPPTLYRGPAHKAVNRAFPRSSPVRLQESTPLVPSLQAWAATVSCQGLIGTLSMEWQKPHKPPMPARVWDEGAHPLASADRSFYLRDSRVCLAGGVRCR